MNLWLVPARIVILSFACILGQETAQVSLDSRAFLHYPKILGRKRPEFAPRGFEIDKRASVMRRFDATRPEFTPYGFEVDKWDPMPHGRPDRHDEIEIGFLDQGTVTWLIGGQRVTVRPRNLTVFWAALPHQILDAEDVSFLHVVTVPLGWVLEWTLPDRLLSPLMQGRIVSETNEALAISDGQLFERWQRDVEAGTDALREIATLELRARLLRLAQSMEVQGDPVRFHADTAGERPHMHLEKAEEMACFVAHNYRSRIQVKDIAERVGLHPNYASTLFRKAFGTTLNAWTTRHRVAHAQRQLITTAEQILPIALDSGFDSLSRFNRAFKQLVGMTPSQYRKRRRPVDG